MGSSSWKWLKGVLTSHWVWSVASWVRAIPAWLPHPWFDSILAEARVWAKPHPPSLVSSGTPGHIQLPPPQPAKHGEHQTQMEGDKWFSDVRRKSHPAQESRSQMAAASQDLMKWQWFGASRIQYGKEGKVRWERVNWQGQQIKNHLYMYQSIYL